MVRMLREEKGIDWDDCPPFFKWGTYLKKETYEITGFNPKTQQEVRQTRRPHDGGGSSPTAVPTYAMN